MAFADEDLETIADEFLALEGAETLTALATTRAANGGNRGFGYDVRPASLPKPAPQIQTKQCARCRQLVYDGGRLCVRHKEQHRKWAVGRIRKKGVPEWKPGGKGRPPNIVRGAVAAEVSLQEALVADAMLELETLKHRVRRMRQELTFARRVARGTV